MARLEPLKRPLSALKQPLSPQNGPYSVNFVTHISSTTTTNSENIAQFYAGRPRKQIERGRNYDGV